MKCRTIAALAVATAVGAFAPRPARAVDLDALQAETPEAASRDLASILGGLRARLDAAVASGRPLDPVSSADLAALESRWPGLAPLRSPDVDALWAQIESLKGRLGGQARDARLRRGQALTRVAGGGAGSAQSLSRLYDNDDRASGSPAASLIQTRQPAGGAVSRQAIPTPPPSSVRLDAAAPPAPSGGKSVVIGGVAYTTLKDGRVSAQPANAQWPVTILRKSGLGLAVESVQLADGSVQKPVLGQKGLWAIEKGGKTLAFRLELAQGASPRTATLWTAKRGLWGALPDAEAAYRADAAASFLEDVRRRFPGQAAPQQLFLDAQGGMTLRAGAVEFLCRFEPTLSGWPDGVTAKGIGLSVYAKTTSAQSFTRTAQYLGSWGLERLLVDTHANTDGGWWWLTGTKAVQSGVVTRFKRGPGGQWIDTGERAKLKDVVLYDGAGIAGQTMHAVDALGEGAADLVGSGAALALAGSPAYLGLVKAGGGDVGAAQQDLWERARANFWGNAAFRELGQTFGGKWYQDKLASVDMSRARMNVGNELASEGWAKTGAVLQGGQQFANQAPTLLAMGGGMSAIGKLGKAGQAAETVVGAYMGGQAVVGFSQSLGSFTGTLLYGDFNLPEGLASLRDFTTQALNAPMTLSIFGPALKRGAARARTPQEPAPPEAPDHLAFLEIPAGAVGYKATGASAFGREGGKPQLYLRTYREDYRVARTQPLEPGEPSAGAARSASAATPEPIDDGRPFVVASQKFKFFFGQVTADLNDDMSAKDRTARLHNEARSKQIAESLARMGIRDTPEGRAALMALLDRAYGSASIQTLKKPHGVTIVKGVDVPTGKLEVSFFYPAGPDGSVDFQGKPAVTTIIPKEFPRAPEPGPGIANNASGESPASLEAINRAKTNEFLILDRQGNVVRKLIGPDAVDFDRRNLRPGQSYAIRNKGTGEVTVLETR